jgi:hypothetical protein
MEMTPGPTIRIKWTRPNLSALLILKKCTKKEKKDISKRKIPK